jgi:hypothetical protein
MIPEKPKAEPGPGSNLTLLGQLGALLIADLDLPARNHAALGPALASPPLAAILQEASSRPLVFTSFDGDHQHLCGLMRSCLLGRGAVPANADSILGYREAVVARSQKEHVLWDDLAILHRCNELWVFTDVPPEPEAITTLCEGMVIEILYFLRMGGKPVRFVATGPLLRAGACQPQSYTFSYAETAKALDAHAWAGALDLVARAAIGGLPFPPIVYHLTDPLDFKYAHWLRSYCYGLGPIPLVAGLAVELADDCVSGPSVGNAVVSWVRLMDLADEAWRIGTLEQKRRPSAVMSLLEQLWKDRDRPLKARQWIDYGIPKAVDPFAWPITANEKDEWKR